MKNIFKKWVAYILKAEAVLVLARYKPKVVAITGSVGKTSTKDAIYAVLSRVSYVRKSEKSFNSEIGLPLTILGVPNAWNNPLGWTLNILKGLWLVIYPHKYPKWLVLEAGIGKPNDMKRTASWLRTDAVVLTAIGETPPHIEFFQSRKHLIDEKMELLKTLKSDGVLVLNADDESIMTAKEKGKCRSITYGFSEDADVRGSGDAISYSEKGVPEGVIFRVDEGGKSVPVIIEGVFGRNHIYAALAALALSAGLKLNMLAAAESLKNYEVPPGRMRLLEGKKDGSLIIDDTYNSSPFACEAALKTLAGIKTSGRRVAVLGDMLELGKHTVSAHKSIGETAGSVLVGKNDALIVVGPRAKSIKEGALENGMPADNIFEFSDSKETAEFVKKFMKAKDIILVKGSQGMRMERIVAPLILHEAERSMLLVRQDPEWLRKP